MESEYLRTYPEVYRPNKCRDARVFTSIREHQSFSEELYNATVGFLYELSATLRWRVYTVRKNFFNDIRSLKGYTYPIAGLFEFFSWYKYWWYSLVLGCSYIFLFSILCTLYFIFLLPILSGMQIATLGPIGMILAMVQMFLQCNTWTVRGVKEFVLPTVVQDILELYLRKSGCGNKLDHLKMQQIPEVPELKAYQLEFWINYVPFEILTYKRWIVTNILLGLLSLIPIVGPILVNILDSPERAFDYYDMWMIRLRLGDKAKRDKFYEKLGQHFAFGLVAGFLEFFPLISVFGLCSNVLAIAISAKDELNSGEVKI